MVKIEDPAAQRAARGGREPGPSSGRPRRRCPICGEPAVDRYRPFCSRRCADIDLGRWLKESYRVPTQDEPETGEGSSKDEE